MPTELFPGLSSSTSVSFAPSQRLPFLHHAHGAFHSRMWRDPRYPTQPAGENPADRTRGALYRTPLQSMPQTSVFEQPIPTTLYSAPTTGPSPPSREKTHQAAADHLQTIAVSAPSGADRSSFIPNVSTTMSHVPPSVAVRDAFETARGSESFDHSVRFQYEQTAGHSPLSHLPPVVETNLTEVTDTPLFVKPPFVFQSGLSSGSDPSSGPPSCTTSPDQLQQQIEAMRIEKCRLQDYLRAAQNNLQSMHQATEAERDRTFREYQKERQIRMRELADLEIAARERLDRIESQIFQHQSGSRFQHNYPPRSSRDSHAYRTNYSATPFSSSSILPHTPRFSYRFSR